MFNGVLSTALPAERVRDKVQSVKGGSCEGTVASSQLRHCHLLPAREVLTARRGLWVRVAARAGGLHLPGALQYGGSGAGQVDGSLRLVALNRRAVRQPISRFIAREVRMSGDPLEE